MAISVGRTIKELESMATSLNISIPKRDDGKKPKKEDYIYPIREHNLIERYGSLENTPLHLQYMLHIKSPMLAGRIDSFKEEQQEEVWDSDEWSMEQKLNGVRCFIVNDGSGIHLYSRHNSDIDLLPIEFTDKILFNDKFEYFKLNKTFIVDCELTSDNPNICTILDGYGVDTSSQLQAVTSVIGSSNDRALSIQLQNNLEFVFNAFDCLFYDGKWIMDDSLSSRREVLYHTIDSLSNSHFNIRKVKYVVENKRDFYKHLISNGLEGTVAKRLDGKYIADTTRNFKGWIKCKRSISYSLGDFNSSITSSTSAFDVLGETNNDISFSFGDTVDAFITGYELGKKGSAFENLIGSIAISVYVEKDDGSLEEREIGKFSGFNLDMRKSMTGYVNGVPVLKPEYYGKVVEVDGQQVTKNGRFAHCVFIGFRYDKLKDACILSEKFLESQVL